ncbi:Transposon Tf2-9 polyprotein [Glycine soja]|uniref:Transposon Tf2-9 polyprotein n=1 Tax=Glycine soja TaxID=3848 RepID=A0A445JKI8_GLYSO|nr:Transposon Tf2-9 polyprotein [Glycine soja]
MDCLPLIEFTYNNSYQASIGMAPFEALYGRKCKTPICWYDDGEAVLLGPEMLQQINEQVKLIREKIKASQDRQKSYYDRRRKPLDFQEGEHVFLKVSPVTGVGRALKARKLTPKYLGPYQILKKIGPIAYHIALPPSLSNFHPVFHVSQLRRYNPDPSHTLAVDEVQVKDNLTYRAQPQKITDRRMKSLRGKKIALVKVQWGTEEGDSTWELEDRMRELYPTPNKASTFGAHFCSKSRKDGIFGVVKCVATSGTSKFQVQQDFGFVQKNACVWLAVESLVQNEFWMFASRSQRSQCRLMYYRLPLVLFECCFAWMLWKLGRIDGDPVLRETRIWATWEYVSSDGGGQQGMSGTWRYVAGVRRPWGHQASSWQSTDKRNKDHKARRLVWWLASCESCVIYGLWPLVIDYQGLENEVRKLGELLVIDYQGDVIDYQALERNWNTVEASGNRLPACIVMAAQLIRDRVEVECLEGVWETLEGNTRCRFRGTIRFTATSLVHPDEPARTLQRTMEWILPTPTPYRLVEPIQVIEVTSSEEDPEEDLEELPPEPAVDALDFLEGDEDPFLEVYSPEEVMSASEADSTEDGGPGEMAINGGSSS